MKQNIDFKYLREHGLVLYEYIRGSQLYGLARPESDEDHGGVYIEPLESLLGVSRFPEDVHNETNDDSWFSLGKYMQLLLNSNPNILESLYVPEDKIIYKHPIMDYILENRDKFITKKCFGSFMGYAKTQMERARNLKKKIVMPIEGPMQSCLEFIMFSEDGGSKPVTTWLSRNGLEQKYCGLVNLDKMICMYCMYYDWGAHIYNVLGINTYEEFEKFVDNHWNSEGCTDPFLDIFFRYVGNSCGDFYYYENFGEVYELNYNSGTLKRIWDKYNKPFGYHGLVSENDCSYQVRLSSIPKGEKPVLTISYNKDGYSAYCRQYTEYHDWKKHHNEERFNLAKKGQYDRKNMMHSARLFSMGIEIARGEGVKIDRSNIDRDWLMSIRQGEVYYDDLMAWLKSKDTEMKDAMANSTIPDEINIDFVDELLIKIRKEFYKL